MKDSRLCCLTVATPPTRYPWIFNLCHCFARTSGTCWLTFRVIFELLRVQRLSDGKIHEMTATAEEVHNENNQLQPCYEELLALKLLFLCDMIKLVGRGVKEHFFLFLSYSSLLPHIHYIALVGGNALLTEFLSFSVILYISKTRQINRNGLLTLAYPSMIILTRTTLMWTPSDSSW